MTRIRPPAVAGLLAYALALVICLASCVLFRPRPPIADALHARGLMVPVAGVSPAQVPDTRSPRGGRIRGRWWGGQPVDPRPFFVTAGQTR